MNTTYKIDVKTWCEADELGGHFNTVAYLLLAIPKGGDSSLAMRTFNRAACDLIDLTFTGKLNVVREDEEPRLIRNPNPDTHEIYEVTVDLDWTDGDFYRQNPALCAAERLDDSIADAQERLRLYLNAPYVNAIRI